MRADLGEATLAELGVAEVEVARDGELQDAVAEELEPLVGGGAVARPGRVGEDVLEALRRERVDQLGQLVDSARRGASLTGAW
jgi:hypothetical protein